MSDTTNPTVTGKGSIPVAEVISGTTLDTDGTLDTKLLITGNQLLNKSLYIDDHLFSNGELRKVNGFFPDGSVSIDSAFTTPLSGEAVNRVKPRSLRKYSVANLSTSIDGTLNGDPIEAGLNLTFENIQKGLDAVVFDTNGAEFKIATTAR